MAKIIEKGVFWVTRCLVCQCKFEADIEDVQYGLFGSSAWDSGIQKQFVYCPRCGNRITLPHDKYIPHDFAKKNTEKYIQLKRSSRAIRDIPKKGDESGRL